MMAGEHTDGKREQMCLNVNPRREASVGREECDKG